VPDSSSVPAYEPMLAESLKALKARVAPHLDASARAEFHALTDPKSPKYLANDPDFAATCIDHVAWGREPR